MYQYVYREDGKMKCWNGVGQKLVGKPERKKLGKNWERWKKGEREKSRGSMWNLKVKLEV